MNEVINAPSKVGLPVGAGPYKASNAKGSEEVSGDTFFNNNFIYYERNPYFETVGEGIRNAKIKYIRFKVVASDRIINALSNGDIDYGDPSATQENIATAENAGAGTRRDPDLRLRLRRYQPPASCPISRCAAPS